MEYITEIVSFIVGALAGGLAVKINSTRKSDDSIKQNNVKAGGDVAGRDIRK